MCEMKPLKFWFVFRGLVAAGACMLTVHGRTREQRGPQTGVANWQGIRTVCEAVDVPVSSNGNIQVYFFLKEL